MDKRHRKYIKSRCKHCGAEFEKRSDSTKSFCNRDCYEAYRKTNGIKTTRKDFKRDLAGQRFGKLTAIAPTEERNQGKVVWLCKCDCGKETRVPSHKLVAGHTKSCGCLNRESTIQQNTTHGGTGSRLYRIWTTMKTRCTNPNHSDYKYYGGRGIGICEEWKNNFDAFRDWAMANGYKENLTIDRKETDGDYSPENCRWATWHEQRINQRRMRR